MNKVSIADAAEQLGVSKEAIHNRIRRGSLESVVEDGIKLVILDNSESAKVVQKRTPIKKIAHQVDERYYKLLEEQNSKLQVKIESLEKETKELRDQKEQMLVDEIVKIENIYQAKDEQLKNILSAISSKFMLEAPSEALEDEHLEVEIEDEEESELIPLKKYLKGNDFSKKRIKKIDKRFKKLFQKDPRVIKVDKKYYMDLIKFDYSDLLD